MILSQSEIVRRIVLELAVASASLKNVSSVLISFFSFSRVFSNIFLHTKHSFTSSDLPLRKKHRESCCSGSAMKPQPSERPQLGRASFNEFSSATIHRVVARSHQRYTRTCTSSSVTLFLLVSPVVSCFAGNSQLSRVLELLFLCSNLQSLHRQSLNNVKISLAGALRAF